MIKKHKNKIILALIGLVLMSIYIFFTTWQERTYKEVHTMYPIEKSKNPEASEEFLKAMEYRIYIKELHPYFDYNSFVMAPLLMKMNYHFKKGVKLLPKDSVEDIVWWTLFYKEIYGLLVPPRNDNSMAYENLPPKEFAKVHDAVYRMIMRYPEGKVYFDIPEIKAFRFKVMAILVEFFRGKYTHRYFGKTQKEKAQKFADDMQSKKNLKHLLSLYKKVQEKYLKDSSNFEAMRLHYYADIVDISAAIILKEIYQDKKLQFPDYMCYSKEASIIQENTQLLLNSLNNKTKQTRTMFINLFDVKHTNNVALFMMMANKCHNLNPKMKDIAKQVYKINNITK